MASMITGQTCDPESAPPAEHMAFTTPSERSDTLQDIDDGGSVPLGTAMAHARAVKLGPWGDRSRLRQDCIKLMIGELRTAGVCTPSTVVVSGFGHRCTLAEAIGYSAAFNTAFEHVRRTRELRDENALRAALGHDLIPVSLTQDNPLADDALAHAIAVELRIA